MANDGFTPNPDGVAASYREQLASQGVECDVSASYNETTGNYDLTIKDTGGEINMSYPAQGTPSSQAAVVFPGDGGSGKGNGLLQVNNGSSNVSYTTGLDGPTNNGATIVYPGMSDAVANGTINPCVSVIANSSNDASANLAEQALVAYCSVNETDIDTVASVSHSRGTLFNQHFTTSIANNEVFSDTQITTMMYDANGTYDTVPTDADFIDVSQRDNVTVIAFPARTWAGSGDRLSNSFSNIARANSNGARIIVATLDYDYYTENGGLDGVTNYNGDSHMTNIYLGINHGQINVALDGELFSSDLEYVVYIPYVDENGRVVRCEIDSNTIKILENSNLSDAEKSIQYSLKTKYHFEVDSQISQQQQNAINQFEGIINSIADNCDLTHVSASSNISNEAFRGMFSRSDAFVNSSNLLDYRIKERLLAAASNVTNIAQTEAELKLLAEQTLSVSERELLFRTDQVEAESTVMRDFRENQLIICSGNASDGTALSPMDVKTFSTGDLDAFRSSGIFDYLLKEEAFSQELAQDLISIKEDGNITGEPWEEFFNQVDALSNCANERSKAARILYDAYDTVYNKLNDFFSSKGLSSIDCDSYDAVCNDITRLENLKSYWERMREVVWYRRECDNYGKNCTSVPYHPFEAIANQNLVVIGESLTAAYEHKANIEEFTQLFNDCERIVMDAQDQVEATYGNAVNEVMPLFTQV